MMHATHEHSQGQASFMFGAMIGGALVALMTTSTGRRLRMRAKEKARELREEMPKSDESNTMSPYDTPLSPS